MQKINGLFISIHAPREGSDTQKWGMGLVDIISIHAPREGSDHGFTSFFSAARYFYPRSPRGERRT